MPSADLFPVWLVAGYHKVFLLSQCNFVPISEQFYDGRSRDPKILENYQFIRIFIAHHKTKNLS